MLPDDFLFTLKTEYPKRSSHQGWQLVRSLIPKLISLHGLEWDGILEGTRAYKVHCDQEGKTGTAFVMMAQTFYGRSLYVEEWIGRDVRTAAQIASEAAWERLSIEALAIGFRPRLPGELPEQYQTQMRFFERERGSALGTPKFSVVK